MLKNFKLLVSILMLIGLVGLVPGTGTVFGAEKAPSQKPTKTRRVPTMSEQTFKKLAEVQEAIDAKEWDQAVQVLKKLRQKKSLNPNEVGQVENMYGYVYFSKGDYPDAINHYLQVVAQGEKIPEGLETTTLYTLAQLYFVTDKYEKALEYMRKWLAKALNPGADPYIFMGQVYYQMKDFPNSTKMIEKGIAVARERGVPIKENWWQLLQYLYYEQENWDRVLDILQILVKDFPKRDYWVQLAGVYGQQGYEKEQLYSMESAHVLGFLTREQDILNFTGLLMQAEVPFRAAYYLAAAMKQGVVERTAKNLKMLGQAWQIAQETKKAIPVFEEAGKKSEDGEILARLASLYLDNDDYPDCIKAANTALNKGGLKKPQSVHVVRGMCQFNTDRLTAARNSFSEARRIARQKKDKSTESLTASWLTYIDREKIRREKLKESI